MILASRGPLGGPLRALLGRLGGFVARLDLGRLGVLFGRLRDPLGLSWVPLGLLSARLRAFWPLVKSCSLPRKCWIWGSGHLKEYSRALEDLRTLPCGGGSMGPPMGGTLWHPNLSGGPRDPLGGTLRDPMARPCST